MGGGVLSAVTSLSELLDVLFLAGNGGGRLAEEGNEPNKDSGLGGRAGDLKVTDGSTAE